MSDETYLERLRRETADRQSAIRAKVRYVVLPASVMLARAGEHYVELRLTDPVSGLLTQGTPCCLVAFPTEEARDAWVAEHELVIASGDSPTDEDAAHVPG